MMTPHMLIGHFSFIIALGQETSLRKVCWLKIELETHHAGFTCPVMRKLHHLLSWISKLITTVSLWHVNVFVL